MFKTIVNAWKTVDLRKKILFTALIILIFRIGSAIPVPFTNILVKGEHLVQEGSTFLNYLIMMTGDAFNYGTLFALSITPYINSSIIMQLLCVAIPPLERLAKEEDGQKKIASITRYVTVVLGIIQSVAYYFYIRSAGYLSTAAALPTRALQWSSRPSSSSSALRQVPRLSCGSVSRSTIRASATVSR